MQYIYMAAAIIFELVGTTLLKASDGFSKPVLTVLSIIAYVISFYGLSKALQTINLSIAYATWSALGIVVTTAISVYIYKEKITAAGIAGLVLIIAGVVILNLFGGVSRG